MKIRSKIFIIVALTTMTLASASELHASELPSERTLPSPENNDTIISDATKNVIETFGELSRTATKLSETALKLLQAQEEIEQRREGNRTSKKGTQRKKVNRQTHSSKKNTSGRVYIPEEPEELEEYVGEPEEIPEEAYTGPRVFISDEEDDHASTMKDAEEFMNESEEEQEKSPKVFISDDENTYTNHDHSDKNMDKATRMQSLWNLQPENLEGGHYVWVPDGQELNTATQGDNSPDLNEMTFWRGDSIPMAIPTKRFGRYDRKLYNWLIYPKGQWHISLSANYGELNTDDSELLSLLKDIDLGGKIYSIKPSVSYFFRHNVCAGLRLAFTKGELAIDNFMVDIDEDINFNLHDVKYSSDSYSAALFLQQHFGLSRRGRFSVYNEIELAYGMGSKHFIRPFDGEMKDTRTKTQSFNINYSPGVSIMVMKNAAFNLSFGIFGFHLQDEKQWENGEENGNRFTSGINFRFNIFNINFGVSIII